MPYCRVMRDNRITELPGAFDESQTPYSFRSFPKYVKVASASHWRFSNILKSCKVIVLGDVNVGKTSLVNRFCHQIFNHNYKATIGVDFEVEQFEILTIPFSMQIWDTAGQERFRCIAAAYYRSAHAILTVFDLNKPSTLSSCPSWMKEALDANIEAPFKFIVGTKRDLMRHEEYSKIECRAHEVAKIMNAEYWAVSSKTGDGVSPMFRRIAALCFQQTIKNDLELQSQPRSFSLGHPVIHVEPCVDAPKRQARCNGRIQQCK